MTGLRDELLAAIEAHMARHPRTLQTALGPSELGCGCDRCLIHLLAGHRTIEPPPWLATIGTAMHAWLDDAMTTHARLNDEVDRWHTETRVHVGTLGGVDVHGHGDLFDAATGTVVDWKLVGITTAKKVDKVGPSTTYRRQVHMYGAGWLARGYDVRNVAICFLPRNERILRAGTRWWEEPYNPAIVNEALTRANSLLAGIQTVGVDAMLALAPPHTGEEFACGKWPGEVSRDTARQLEGLIA